VRILFTADDAVTADKLRPGLRSCEITVHPFARTLKRRETRRGHTTSILKEDGHVQTLR